VPVSKDRCLCGRKVITAGRNYTVEIGWGARKIKKALGKTSLEYARKIETELKRGRVPESPLTWRQIRYAYVRKLELEKRNKVYVENCRTRLKKFADAWGDDLTASELTPQMIESVKLDLLEKKLTTTTVNRYVAAARAAWNYSVVDDLPSPFRRVRNFREDNEVTEHLSLKQREKLLVAAKRVSQTLYEVVVVAMGTGLRKSEVLNLRRDEVNYDNHSLTTTTKGGRVRTVALSPGVEFVLAAIPDNDTPWFWVSHTGRPYHKDWRRPWDKAKAMAGIPKEFRFHGLRHDFGTRVLAGTSNLRTTQEALGHSDPKTTTRYAHVLTDQLREAANLADPVGVSATPTNP